MADRLHDVSDDNPDDNADHNADNAWVSDLLRESTDSLAAAPEATMPPEVWARLENALEAERVVVPLSSRASRRSAGSHRGRWVTGVAAAAAVVVVGSLLVSNTSQAPAPVAGTAAQMDAPADSIVVKSGAAVPTSRLLASGTEYSADSLGTQITSLFRDTLGVTKATDVDAMPEKPVEAMPGEDFMSDMGALRTCVQSLSGTPEGRALVVDRGSFAGQPAGLIVISTWEHDMPSMVTPSALVATAKGDLAVWIVDPTCMPVMNAEGAKPHAVAIDW
jgi:hypothetical protein